VKKLRAQYGTIYKIPLAGRYFTVVSSAATIASVVSKSPKTLKSLNDRAVRTISGVAPHRVSFISSLLQHQVFGIIASKMGKRSMGSFFIPMSQDLSSRLDQLAPDGSPAHLPLIAIVNETLYRTSAPAFFGQKIPDTYHDFLALDRHIFYLINDIPFYRRGSYLASERLTKTLVPYVQEAMDGLGEDDIYVEGASVPILDSLYELKKADVSTVEVARVLIAVVWGFHSNIIHTIIAACAFLISDPVSCRRISEELRTTIVKRWGDLDTFLREEPLVLDDAEFAIMDSILHETLRLASAASSAREVAQDTTVVGDNGELYVLRKGEFVLADVSGLHYDPSVFPNPETFIPDRFLDEDISHSARSIKNLVPWGGGPFVCKGREYAEYIVKMWLIQFLVKYDTSFTVPLSPLLCPNTSPTIARLSGNPIIRLQRHKGL